MTLNVDNAIDLTNLLKKWIEEDEFYKIHPKFNVDNSFLVEHKLIDTIIQIDVSENPLHICILQEGNLMEDQPQILEKTKAFTFVSLSNVYSNLYRFDVYPVFRYDDQNQLSSIVLQRQIYPDDLTRNKFFDYLSQMVRAHMTVGEIIGIMEYGKNLRDNE